MSRLPGFVVSAVLGLVATSPAAEPQPLKSGDWEQHGFTAQQREQIRGAFQQAIDSKAIPGGSLLLIHKGEVIFREGFGVAKLGTDRPFSPDAPCRIASVTKPHSATVLVRLAAAGKLTLEEPVDKWLPEFKGVKVQGQGPAQHAPTLAQCLSHTAGFPGNDERRRTEADAGGGTLAEAVARLASQELVTEPGTKYTYTGYGYMVAGRVAEVAAGKDFATLMDELLLEPIGAQTATFTPPPEIAARMPLFYERDQSGFKLRTGDASLRTINPGGGLISTLDDVARMLLLHRNHGQVDGRQIIPAEWLAKMYVPQPATLPGGYGLGFNVLRRRPDGSARRIQHIGASGTLALLDFDADLIVVVFTQVSGGRNQWRDQLVQTIAGVFGESPTDR